MSQDDANYLCEQLEDAYKHMSTFDQYNAEVCCEQQLRYLVSISCSSTVVS